MAVFLQDESTVNSCHYLDVATLAKRTAATTNGTGQQPPGTAVPLAEGSCNQGPTVIMSDAVNYAGGAAKKGAAYRRKGKNRNCCIG